MLTRSVSNFFSIAPNFDKVVKSAPTAFDPQSTKQVFQKMSSAAMMSISAPLNLSIIWMGAFLAYFANIGFAPTSDARYKRILIHIVESMKTKPNT